MLKIDDHELDTQKDIPDFENETSDEELGDLFTKRKGGLDDTSEDDMHECKTPTKKKKDCEEESQLTPTVYDRSRTTPEPIRYMFHCSNLVIVSKII